MMQVRQAHPSDADVLVDMGLRFHATTPYAALMPANADAMHQTVLRMLEEATENAVFLAEEDGIAIGMIGLCHYWHPLSGESIVTDLFWWVEPKARGYAGLRLLRRAEEWARAKGAARFQMVAPDRRIEHLYERLGYTRVEVSYQKSL